jgi:hypothetical protein
MGPRTIEIPHRENPIAGDMPYIELLGKSYQEALVEAFGDMGRSHFIILD